MKKVVLFGAGSGLKDIISIMPAGVEVISISDNDSKKHNTSYGNYKIIPPAEIKNTKFDYLIITTRSHEEVRNSLVKQGIDDSKILSLYNNAKPGAEANKDIIRLNKELGFSIPLIHLCSMYIWPAAYNNSSYFNDDYVRYMSLNLIAQNFNEKKMPGNIAELGVYRGDLSAFLNRIFPTKKLYLFDTFEGFSEKDIKVEDANKFSISASTDFSDTSLESVLSKMPIRENVIPCKGYFPESAKGVEDTFCLVSLDVDLYAPTIAGLHYFYARLVKGGYIFVHDYNNLRYQGAKKAVTEFL